MARSVIVGAVRTPFGRLGGGLASRPATELGAIAIRAALERAGIEPHEPQYVIMGQVLQGGAGQAPARQAAIAAGLPIETPADTINKVCASSIRAVEIADSMIRAGDVELVVTGGMESMSNAPYALAQARFGYRLGDGTLIDLMMHDGLVSSFDGRHMVEQASFVSRELGISRETQDAWAFRSHQRAVAAIDAGRFADEIVPVGELDTDESPRRDTSLEKLASLKPVFDPEGTTTAGNAPGVNDGASCVLVASEEWARAARDRAARDDRLAGLRRRRVRLPRAHAGEGGGSRAREGRARRSTTSRRVEINEAFASVAAHSTRLLGADEEIVNVNGGAVALGHPIGASGGRILATLVHELRREGGGLGLAAICSGGGQGDALLIEVVTEGEVRAAGGVIVRDGARAARPPAALRRLVAAEGQARSGRVVGGGGAPRGRGGDRPPLRARRGGRPDVLPRQPGPRQGGALLPDGVGRRARRAERGRRGALGAARRGARRC